MTKVKDLQYTERDFLHLFYVGITQTDQGMTERDRGDESKVPGDDSKGPNILIIDCKLQYLLP